MDQEEEKKDTADIVNPAILESFDGDLDEWMEWNKQAEEFKEQVKSEAEENDGIERQLTADGKSVEWFNIRAEQTVRSDSAQNVQASMEQAAEQADTYEGSENESVVLRYETEKLVSEVSYHPYQGQPGVLSKEDQGAKIHPIDVTDPHYVNYTPDPYYEYGIGPEPKRPRGGGGPGGFAIASMCCGIASLLLICLYGFPLNIVAIVMGSVALSRKQKTTGGKVMSIVGISTASLSLILMIAYIVYFIMGVY